MRILLAIALIVTFATASTVGAQQVVAPRFATQPPPELVRESASETGAEAQLFRRQPVTEAREAGGAAAVAREISARTALAIVGAIVVVGALIALLI